MLRVALTGGVGSGKSAAAAMLRALGAQVSHSDEVGRALMQPGQPVFAGIREHFGPAVLQANGELDRAALASIAFAQGRVEELNAIVHPAVIAAQAQWMERVRADDPSAVAIVESALIFETRHGDSVSGQASAPWRSRFDRIVVITAPVELRRRRYVERVLQSAGRDAAAASADFDQRAAAQWTDKRKAALADTVIRNDGSLQDLQHHMAHLYQTLRQEAADDATEAM
ncbi:MAG: dephospho-CoA kinase [Janthinobacterium lividum]